MCGPVTCVTSQDGEKTAASDSRVCSNKTLWDGVGTDYYYDWDFGTDYYYKGEKGLGVRCNGSQMGTIYSWYKYNNGEPFSGLKQNCEDKSDRVFAAGKPCPNRTYYLSLYKSEWCSLSYLAPYLPICINSYAWLKNTTIDQARLDDPHYCQESCATPDLNCIACSGDKFFNCSRSNTCIHPDLECDGHPQCPDNEDEDFDRCWRKYFEKKIVKQFASFKCNSAMYPKIYTIATACNGIIECFNGLDEEICNTDYTTPILVVAIFLVLGLFFGLKIPHYMEFIKNKNEAMNVTCQFEQLIQRLRENIKDQENNRKINSFLLFILNTKETKFNKVFLTNFYNIIETALENEAKEVFCYLKRNIHPDVTKDIVEHKFRGLVTKINDFIEEHIRSPSPFIEFQDKVTSTPSLRMTLSTLGAMISLLSHFADIVKDACIAVSLLVIAGGPSAIAEFHQNFSSAIVISWMVTIIIPIIISSLNLAITEPFLVFPRLRATRGGRALAALGCLVLSPLNTVILKTRLEMTQQRAIEAARVLGADTLDLYNQCEVIEEKIQEYLQIEIGE